MEGGWAEIAPLILEEVTVTYEGRARPAVEGVSLELRPGELVALTGPNGGGKTTILRAASGVVPSVVRGRVDGEISVDGLDPRRERVSHLVQYMQQDPKAQVIGPTVLLEAAAAPLMMGLPRGEVWERSLQALRMVGAERLAPRSTATLSGGELERAAIAGVLSARPRYLLLDEPLSYLDCEGRRTVLELIDEVRRSGVGILVATHDPSMASRADRSFIVNVRVEPGVFEAPQPSWGSRRSLGRRGETLLEARDVNVSYPGRGVVLRGTTLSVEKGSLVVVWGPNGSGKTTLLLVLSGLIKPTRGTVRAIEKPSLLPQDPLLLFSKATLAEELRGREPPEWAEHLARVPVLQLSWGSLRLAALALTVARGSRLLLLDEPTSGLDPWNRLKVIRVLRRLADEGYAIVAASHDPWLSRAADRVFCLRRGVLEACSGDC